MRCCAPMRALRHVVRAIGLTALGGLLAWMAMAVVAWRTDAEALDLVTILLLFAQLVAVPMGLGLLRAPIHPPLATGLFRLGRRGVGLGGLAALLSLALPRGDLAAAVAAIYLVPALLIGAAVLLGARATSLATVVAGVSLAFGALLFVLHRQDLAFSWLPELGLQVASVHLHLVGFALVAMAGVVSGLGSPAGTAAAITLGAGVALGLFGELIEPWARIGSAGLVATGVGLLVAGTLSRLSDQRLPAVSRRLLFVSVALSVYVVGAVVVGTFATALGGQPGDVGSTVRLHGTFGAVGVVFIGLLGWRLARVSDA